MAFLFTAVYFILPYLPSFAVGSLFSVDVTKKVHSFNEGEPGDCLRGSLNFVSLTAVQIYEFHISKIIIHHLDGLFGPNTLISSQLAC